MTAHRSSSFTETRATCCITQALCACLMAVGPCGDSSTWQPTISAWTRSRRVMSGLLLRGNPSGPFVLVGFCYGAVVAREIACQLRAEGHEVSLLALLGVTPLEFPTLLAASARDRWHRTKGPPMPKFLPLTRYHLERVWRLPAPERPRYLVRRGLNVLTRIGKRVGRQGSQSTSVHDALQRAHAAHHPVTYRGRTLVVLHAEETVLYTDDPARDWAALADHIDLEVLPGAEHAMLEEPGSSRLAELIHDRLSSIG